MLKPILNSNLIYQSNAKVSEVRQLIMNGNIKPDGKMTETPDNFKTGFELKNHQKRMLTEMLNKEDLEYRVSSHLNGFCICDKVGAGKSIEILSLICKRPLVNKHNINKLIYKINKYMNFIGLEFKDCIYFKTNMIVVPHNIFNQWLSYIVNFTKLTFYTISYKKDITNLNLNNIIKGEYNILLVKSTRYNDLMKFIYNKYPFYENVVNIKSPYLLNLKSKMNDIKNKFNIFYNLSHENNYNHFF